MLSIFGRADRKSSFCDGLSRRDVLKIGGLAVSGISLPHILRAEAQAAAGPSHKATIMVFLPGGPPHQDMWDIKVDAPAEIRGEFNPIRTNVPGIEICELFPKIAGMMDRFVPIRSIVGANVGHDAFQCMTGQTHLDPPVGGWPSFGAWVSKVNGPVHDSIPPHLSLFYKTGEPRWGNPGSGGFLGGKHAPFRLVGGQEDSRKSSDMVLQGISLERLRDRKCLLNSFDRFRRDVDSSGVMEGIDAFNQQAMGILTSPRLLDALDLSRESPKVAERYGPGDPRFRADGAPKVVENFLVARRLVEAGARVVSLNFSRWDWHRDNFKRAREDFPLLDNAVSALVSDLHERGLDRDVSVVVWGEFGRSPRINGSAGRDHWPRVSCALLAGGGMRTGQVVGATNRLGEYAKERPVTFQDVLATLYHNMGLDIGLVQERDLGGRPHFAVDHDAKPIRELV